MTGANDFRGVWNLVGSGAVDVGDSDLDDLDDDLTDDEYDDRADAWLYGSGDEAMSYVAARGRRLEVDSEGSFTEDLNELGAYTFLDLDGLDIDDSEPFPADLEAEDDDWVVITDTTDEGSVLRIDTDDLQVRETLEIDEDGDLIRTQHVVADGLYLSRYALVYRR